MANLADKYIKQTITEILEEGCWDKEPRAKWSDGTPAHTKFVTQKTFNYDISKGEFPITTLRTTVLKGAFYDIDAIYIKQTNVLEDMHPSIKNWWKDFVVKTFNKTALLNKWVEWAYFKEESEYGEKVPNDFQQSSLGATYGYTVKRYDLMNTLLKGLEENPFGRRHSINLNQEQQKIDDPLALQPCAFETLWSVRETDSEKRYLDLSLIQRSMDFIVTSSINPAQYVMFGMMVANHLTFKTGIKYEVGKFLHVVQNCHIYDRHLDSAKEILKRESTGKTPQIKLKCEPKDFYEHKWEDFEFTNLEGIKPLEQKLEIAI